MAVLSTAFQKNAFQNNAFQIATTAAAAVESGLGGRPLHDPSYWKRQREYLEQREREQAQREAAEAKAKAEHAETLRHIVAHGGRTAEELVAERTAYMKAVREAEEAAIALLLLS